MKNAKIYSIGVDRGGTWTRVAAFDTRFKRIKETRFRSADLRALPQALLRVLARWPGAAQAPLVIATRGAMSRRWKKPFLIDALAGKLNLIDVISDAEAAHRAAFGGGPGLLLLAGTGAVVLSGRPGAFKLTGGKNPPSGDPGSGRWLGRQYLKSRGRLGEAGKMTHGRCAAYARKLLARAEAGDAACALVTAAARHELVSLLAEAAPRSGAVKAALAGGLMDCDYFRNGLPGAAKAALPGRRIELKRLPMSAEEAAARLAGEK